MRKPLTKDIQTKTGMRRIDIPGARSVMTVTTMLMPVPIVPKPVTMTPSVHQSMLWRAVKGISVSGA